MKAILFLYTISITLAIVYLNLSDTFSMYTFWSLTLIDKIISFYVVTSLFFSPLLFLISDVINYKR